MHKIRIISLIPILIVFLLPLLEQKQQHAIVVVAAVTVTKNNDNDNEEEIMARMMNTIRGDSSHERKIRRKTQEEQEVEEVEEVEEFSTNTNTTEINIGGVFAPEYQQDIRGGVDVTEAIPWYAVFEDTVLCGGALVQGDIVLTAAHCVYKKFPKQLRIGSLERNNGGTLVNVNFGRIHPDYNGKIGDGADVAVMSIDRFLDNEVAYVNPEALVPKPGDQFFVAGFGLLGRAGYYNYNNNLPSTLQGIFIDYVPNCGKRFYGYNPTFQICGDVNPHKGTCAGDSGSPVVLAGTNNVVGINSFSNGDCRYQSIDVYTRVSFYSQWIYQQICTLTTQDEADKPAFCSEINQGCGLFFNSFSALSNLASRYFGF